MKIGQGIFNLFQLICRVLPSSVPDPAQLEGVSFNLEISRTNCQHFNFYVMEKVREWPEGMLSLSK